MKEWIITNGLGGFASSTDFGGMNTRRYHGLLIASLNPPQNRTLVLSKIDESIEIGEKKYCFYTNKVKGYIQEGYKYLEKFEKEIMPIYTFKINDVLIEKTICMVHEKNAVVIVYKISNKKLKARINLTPLVNFRDFHSETHTQLFDYNQHILENKIQIDYKNGNMLNLYVSDSNYKQHNHDIFYAMHYDVEQERGFDADENHFIPGTFSVDLKPNEDKIITVVCSLEGKYGININEIQNINGEEIVKQEIKRINKQITESKLLSNKDNKLYIESNDLYKQLILKYMVASDNFVVYRDSTKLHTTLAGYPWFLDWGRDSFISFEGLLLLTKKFQIAREVLLTFSNKLKCGIIPNGFSEYDGKPLYNSVDSSLLFFEAVNKYIEYTNDYDFVKEKLYGVMKSIINNYIDGTNLDNNNIYLDERDFLLSAGTEDTQNTWMDAKVNGKAITPRNGKSVEINAMWYNALTIMYKLNKKWNKHIAQIEYSYLASKTKRSFMKKFYNEDKNCLYDVLGDDRIRPNQIFALSLSYPVLECDKKIAKEVFVTVTKRLLNKYGLQTLAKGEKDYSPIYEGDSEERDSKYHQGITWPWLLGPYYDALNNLIKYEKDEEQKQKLEKSLNKFKGSVAEVFINEMIDGNTIGGISEVYDSKENSKGKGAFEQAWSVSEVFKILLKN